MSITKYFISNRIEKCELKLKVLTIQKEDAERAIAEVDSHIKECQAELDSYKSDMKKIDLIDGQMEKVSNVESKTTI